MKSEGTLQQRFSVGHILRFNPLAVRGEASCVLVLYLLHAESVRLMALNSASSTLLRSAGGGVFTPDDSDFNLLANTVSSVCGKRFYSSESRIPLQGREVQ